MNRSGGQDPAKRSRWPLAFFYALTVFMLLTDLFFLPDESGVYFWSDAIINVIASFLFGYPGTAVFMSLSLIIKCLLAKGISYDLVAAVLSQLPLGLLVASRRRSMRRLNTPGHIVHFFSFTTMGSFMNTVMYIFMQQMRDRILDRTLLLDGLCMMVSSVCAVGLVSIPLLVLYQRLKLGADPAPAPYQLTWTRTQAFVMPFLLAISVLFTWECLSGEMDKYETWTKIFLTVMSEACICGGILYLYVRYRRWTLLCFGICLALFIAFSLIYYDTGEGWMILLPYCVYCLLRFVFYRRILAHSRKSRLVRILLNGVHCVTALLLALTVALNNVIYLLPRADGTEKTAVVLGAPMVGRSASGLLEERIRAAIGYADRNPDSVFYVTGGLKPKADITEGEYIRINLQAARISPKRIVTEKEAKTTAANFSNIIALMAEHGAAPDEPAVLITSAFHCPRATLYAKRAGFTRLRYVLVRTDWYETCTWMVREIFAYILTLAGA